MAYKKIIPKIPPTTHRELSRFMEQVVKALNEIYKELDRLESDKADA